MPKQQSVKINEAKPVRTEGIKDKSSTTSPPSVTQQAENQLRT